MMARPEWTPLGHAQSPPRRPSSGRTNAFALTGRVDINAADDAALKACCSNDDPVGNGYIGFSGRQLFRNPCRRKTLGDGRYHMRRVIPSVGFAQGTDDPAANVISIGWQRTSDLHCALHDRGSWFSPMRSRSPEPPTAEPSRLLPRQAVVFEHLVGKQGQHAGKPAPLQPPLPPDPHDPSLRAMNWSGILCRLCKRIDIRGRFRRRGGRR